MMIVLVVLRGQPMSVMTWRRARMRMRMKG